MKNILKMSWTFFISFFIFGSFFINLTTGQQDQGAQLLPPAAHSHGASAAAAQPCKYFFQKKYFQKKFLKFFETLL